MNTTTTTTWKLTISHILFVERKKKCVNCDAITTKCKSFEKEQKNLGLT